MVQLRAVFSANGYTEGSSLPMASPLTPKWLFKEGKYLVVYGREILAECYKAQCSVPSRQSHPCSPSPRRRATPPGGTQGCWGSGAEWGILRLGHTHPHQSHLGSQHAHRIAGSQTRTYHCRSGTPPCCRPLPLDKDNNNHLSWKPR